MHLSSHNLTSSENLLEDLSDEELAACVGGCDIQLTVSEQEVAEVPLVELPFLGDVSAHVITDITAIGIRYDPNGSGRFRSDRNVKEEVAEVDVHAILKGIANLPIATWKYKNQDETIRHIGPMAQDFAATFNVGESDRFIEVVDANGIALAAIQALYQKLQAQDTQINELQTQLIQLKQQLIEK
ncbi:tail fiber domain-containing protein [Calothrix sp. NIES-2098]|uniref:tail fiber domain-containing protein n=1 Tax=Calothrix sp. NIES-2098 TaxID=1954171 RepID=UPI000B5FDC70|nr:hypothetical protein NIES2098_57610 [Calothrix sp. NIES-2098]